MKEDGGLRQHIGTTLYMDCTGEKRHVTKDEGLWTNGTMEHQPQQIGHYTADRGTLWDIGHLTGNKRILQTIGKSSTIKQGRESDQQNSNREGAFQWLRKYHHKEKDNYRTMLLHQVICH